MSAKKSKTVSLIKKLWIKFCDRFGTSVIHPQYVVRKMQEEAIIEAKKYAKGSLIDIGCGRMPYRDELEPLVDSYIGVDHPQVSKLYKSGRKPEVLADAGKLPFSDKNFDIALLIQVLEHIEFPEKAIMEASRVLKPSGTLIISLPFLYSLHDMPYDFGRYTSTALKGFVERSNLKIVKIKSQGGFIDFWLLSLNTFLVKRINDIIHSDLNIYSILLLIVLIALSIPIVLINNLLIVFLDLLACIFTKYPNYFPLDYLIIAKKKVL